MKDQICESHIEEPLLLSSVSILISIYQFITLSFFMAPADATASPSTSEEVVQGTLHSPSASPSNIALQNLCDSRGDLLGRIHNLKKDLQEWRGKLDTQVKTYREELGDLKNTLNLEVEQLKSEFEDLRKSLRKQLDDATNMGSMIHGLDKKLEESVPDLMKETNVNKVEEPGP